MRKVGEKIGGFGEKMVKLLVVLGQFGGVGGGHFGGIWRVGEVKTDGWVRLDLGCG